jgi:hypothetical protein
LGTSSADHPPLLGLGWQDTTINVWETKEGMLVRQLKGHGHWVNTLALSTEHALRTGPFDHTGADPPGDAEEAKKAARKRCVSGGASADECPGHGGRLDASAPVLIAHAR